MDTLFETYRRNDDGPIALTLMDLKGAFIVLVSGLLIAVLSYLFELVFKFAEKVLFHN